MRSRVQAPTLGDFERLILLGLLRLGDDAYGMNIRREIEERTGRTVSLGAVYTTLDRLERKDLVRHHIGGPTPERGGRRRKHYRLQPTGARALRESTRAYNRMTDGLNKLLETL